MGFFNELMRRALDTGEYYCPECGALMEFEDEKWRDTLVCLECGHSMDLDMYGFADEDEYNAMFPTREEVLGIEDDDEDDD